jgi:hypothetical protein
MQGFVRRTAAAVVVAVSLGFAGVAAADPILVNGGFEDLDFSGWDLDDVSGFSVVNCFGSPVAEGDCAAFLGTADGSTGTLSQTFATLPGVHYALTFSFLWDGNTPMDFTASVNGVPLFSRIDPPQIPDFFSVTRLFTATGATSTLSFTFHDDPGFIGLDAVAVAVPEPASVLLVGLGLAGIGFASRRRKA